MTKGERHERAREGGQHLAGPPWGGWGHHVRGLRRAFRDPKDDGGVGPTRSTRGTCNVPEVL